MSVLCIKFDRTFLFLLQHLGSNSSSSSRHSRVKQGHCLVHRTLAPASSLHQLLTLHSEPRHLEVKTLLSNWSVMFVGSLFFFTFTESSWYSIIWLICVFLDAARYYQLLEFIEWYASTVQILWVLSQGSRLYKSVKAFQEGGKEKKKN